MAILPPGENALLDLFGTVMHFVNVTVPDEDRATLVSLPSRPLAKKHIIANIACATYDYAFERTLDIGAYELYDICAIYEQFQPLAQDGAQLSFSWIFTSIVYAICMQIARTQPLPSGKKRASRYVIIRAPEFVEHPPIKRLKELCTRPAHNKLLDGIDVFDEGAFELPLHPNPSSP